MDKNTAAQAIRRLAVQYQGMVEAADALEQIGSLEQHEAEVRARLAAAQADEAKALAKLGDLERATATELVVLEGIRAQGATEAQAQRDAALEQANEIIEGTRARAQELIAAATAESEKLHELTIREQTAAGQRLEQLVREETDALARKVAAERGADEAQAKLDTIRESIANLAKA